MKRKVYETDVEDAYLYEWILVHLIYGAGNATAMNRSHVIRLNATPDQEVYFRKACGVARHTYNWALARWKEARA